MSSLNDILSQTVLKNASGPTLPVLSLPPLRSQAPTLPPIPQAPQYYFLNLRSFVEILNLVEIDQHLKSLKIELKLELIKSGEVHDVFDYIDKLQTKHQAEIEAAPKGNLLTLISNLNNGAKVNNLRNLSGLMLGEDWAQIEKAYLFRIPWNAQTDKTIAISDEQFMVVMIYEKVLEGRWIVIYSSASLETAKANYLLSCINNRLLTKKGEKTKIQPVSLQKSNSVSFALSLPPGEEIFIFDTNVFYEKENFCQYNLSDKIFTILITSVVLHELDTLKMRDRDRKAISIINKIESAMSPQKEMEKFVLICNKKVRIMLFIFEPEENAYISGFQQTIGDDRLIMTTRAISMANPQNPVILISQDPNVRVKCKGIGLKTDKILK